MKINITGFVLLMTLSMHLMAQPSKEDITRWEKISSNITIIRDNWGIPHIYGKTDADAVFGLMYAQCEDDFPRIEMNYIEKLGRLAEVKGESELYNDLLIRMVIDTNDAIADYNKVPEWFRKLMNAHADGINYFLYKHPEIKPALLTHFEPWFSMLWTDGSIGAINTAGLGEKDLKNLYGDEGGTGEVIPHTKGGLYEPYEERLSGSNGFAFAPSITESGNSILYINPHVTFYFRPEVHVVSEEGLNVYGAVTWGQFFVYQGFNEHCGWMHTSSAADVADIYIEKIKKDGGKWTYEYDGNQKEVTEKKIVLKYLTDATILDGNHAQHKMKTKTVNALYTHHGPIMAKRNGQWMSMKANNRIMNGLIQCWQRNKTSSFADYKKLMDLVSNPSNNTVYADAEGNIAYWHGNFMPVRDAKFDWSRPVDGTTSATEWKGLHKVDEMIHLYNPDNGWIQNCNSTPFTAAGSNSPKRVNYPAYMAPDGENFRSINAQRVLSVPRKYTIDSVIAAGYDRYLSAFPILIPALIRAYDSQAAGYNTLKEPIEELRKWDFYCNEKSIATTLAIYWAEMVSGVINNYQSIVQSPDFVSKTREFAASASADTLLKPLAEVVTKLTTDFGSWKKPWGDINRYQRISSDIDEKFDDTKPSIPVGFASTTWGMIPAYVSKTFPGTKKRYGVAGNSFICAVEFGKRIKAKSLLAGGESGNPESKHFTDQLEMYAKGKFKDVLFYKEDVLKHAEETYHPGVRRKGSPK